METGYDFYVRAVSPDMDYAIVTQQKELSYVVAARCAKDLNRRGFRGVKVCAKPGRREIIAAEFDGNGILQVVNCYAD